MNYTGSNCWRSGSVLDWNASGPGSKQGNSSVNLALVFFCLFSFFDS